MIEQFTVGFKTQNKWSWLAALDFFLGGTGAGAFLVSMFFDFSPGMIAGLASVALGALALLLDLGRPERSWRAVSKVSYSWISRGTLFSAFFLAFGILFILPELLPGIPWSKETGLGKAIGIIAALGAMGVMVYTGFLLSHSPSIPFWNTTLLPLLFALYAFTCGAGLLFIMLPVSGQSSINIREVERLGILLLAGTLVFLWIYILNMYYATMAAKESVRLLIKGKLALSFLVGVNGIGLIAPLVMMLYTYFSAGAGSPAAVLTIAGLLMLFGGLIFRYAMLKAGVYAPIV